MGECGKGHLGVSFLRVSMDAVGNFFLLGCGLDGYFREQGLPLDIQECLERFHSERVDYLSR